MARQANGTYLQPANTAAVSGQTISSTAFNTLITDVGTEITNSLDRLGRSAMSAALPMGGQKITGMADPTVPTDGATKNYVDTTTASFFSTGDMKPTLKTTPDTGWLLLDDGRFGSAASNATNRANNDTQALFNLFFNNIQDAYAPLFTSGGALTTRAAQTNATTAWAANCQMALPRSVGRVFGNSANAVSSGGLTARALAQNGGTETIALATTNLPPYTPAGSIANGAISISQNAAVNGGGASTGGGAFGLNSPGAATITASQGTSAFSGSAQGCSSTPFSIIQPAVWVNWMIKL